MESGPQPKYDDKGMRVYSKEEFEAFEGKYDKDGFYILPEGDFFDCFGYYFDKEGVDNIGGFYQDGTGEYISPDAYDEDVYQDYYDELCGSDSDGEEGENGPAEEDKNTVDEYNIPEDEANRGIRLEHCINVIAWLME